MTIQGQRVISTTGSSASAIPSSFTVFRMRRPMPSARSETRCCCTALASSEPIQIYKQYVDAYRLGYHEQDELKATFPAYEGALDLPNSRPLRKLTPAR